MSGVTGKYHRSVDESAVGGTEGIDTRSSVKLGMADPCPTWLPGACKYALAAPQPDQRPSPVYKIDLPDIVWLL